MNCELMSLKKFHLKKLHAIELNVKSPILHACNFSKENSYVADHVTLNTFTHLVVFS